jgi:hypothetical protein
VHATSSGGYCRRPRPPPAIGGIFTLEKTRRFAAAAAVSVPDAGVRQRAVECGESVVALQVSVRILACNSRSTTTYGLCLLASSPALDYSNTLRPLPALVCLLKPFACHTTTALPSSASTPCLRLLLVRRRLFPPSLPSFALSPLLYDPLVKASLRSSVIFLSAVNLVRQIAPKRSFDPAVSLALPRASSAVPGPVQLSPSWVLLFLILAANYAIC